MAQRNDASLFDRFIRPMLKHLRHIAGLTQGEHTVDDLKNEAWLIAEEIKAERGAEIEPDDDEFQAAVVSRLHKLFGRFVNRAMRFAVRLDLEERGDDGECRANALAARLTSAEQYEPQVAIQLAADADEADKRINARFSEAVAYYRVFDQFDGDGDAIARYLAIRSATLAARLAKADLTARRQPSVFDGVTAVPADFTPRRGVWRSRRAPTRFRRVCSVMRPAQKHLFLRYGGVFR